MPEDTSSSVIDTSTVVSHLVQDTSTTSSGSSYMSTTASTFSTAIRTESSSSAVLHRTTAGEDEDDGSESHSAFDPTTTLTSSHMASSSSAPATHITKTLTHGYGTASASTFKTPDTKHSTSLLADTHSAVAVVRASSAPVASSEIAEPTVTTTTVTSTIFKHHSVTAISSGTPSSHSPSSLAWRTTKSTSHLLPTVSATSISPSTGFSWRATPTSTSGQSSTIKQTSSHLFRGSTATTDIRSTASSSPTVGVIRTLPGAASSGASTGAHQSSTATAPQPDHTSAHFTSGTVSNTHISNTWTLHTTATAFHTDSISHTQTATSAFITQSPSTGTHTTKTPTTPDITGTVASGTGIVIIIPGVSTSRNITIPLSPDDNIPVTGTISMSTSSPPVTTPFGASSQSASATQNTTPAVSPHVTGLVTTIHPTSTETKVVTVEMPTTEQTQRPTPTASVAVPSEGSSQLTAQATGSKKAPGPAPAPTSDIADNGVVNPVSPMFLTVTETKTVTEKTTETRTVMMTVTATVDR
ncbi:hypothetical protein BDV30DRAFT_250141 [Aspergillus minisclerotigenes]|uniref:Uncharacterized protein n=1 Tax=Aspergillus minisclerotigenes TaxID=656917 RepID=A0A5N6IX54_9EURO|nr:hypothetical protein BDV30DRAFT_250141 [Aspergillus minisclerotigenes]